MSLLVISDLHIWGPEDPVYLSLLELIRTRTGSGDTVVLAGDLFDLFVGNKEVFTKRYSEFFETLYQASQLGVEFHYIEGNHDFQIHQAFHRIKKMQIHPHDVRLELDGKKIFIAHGDTVDSRDYGYRFLRGFFRSPLMKAFIHFAPGKWIEKIGETSSHKSRNRKPLLPADLPMNRMEKLRTIYRSFAAEKLAEGYDFVVLGHCHDLDEMMFTVGGRKGQYVNVGYPRVHGSYLCWSAGEEKIQRERMPIL